MQGCSRMNSIMLTSCSCVLSLYGSLSLLIFLCIVWIVPIACCYSLSRWLNYGFGFGANRMVLRLQIKAHNMMVAFRIVTMAIRILFLKWVGLWLALSVEGWQLSCAARCAVPLPVYPQPHHRGALPVALKFSIVVTLLIEMIHFRSL